MDVHPLIITSISIGFIHTLLGPDHYLPFVVMGKARRWSMSKQLTLTAFCGLGHILGSILLGFIGIGIGVTVGNLSHIEGIRGDLAAWALTGFGLAYTVWGIRIGLRSKQHTHEHDHSQEGSHHHSHHHLGVHGHVHGNPTSLTPWMLFIIFILGPCEPLIPILMFPAADQSWQLLITVTIAFGLTTLVTMIVMVWILSRGLVSISLDRFEPYIHAIAGMIIASSGFAILLLGL